jgi:hypothetical protein
MHLMLASLGVVCSLACVGPSCCRGVACSCARAVGQIDRSFKQVGMLLPTCVAGGALGSVSPTEWLFDLFMAESGCVLLYAEYALQPAVL